MFFTRKKSKPLSPKGHRDKFHPALRLKKKKKEEKKNPNQLTSSVILNSLKLLSLSMQWGVDLVGGKGEADDGTSRVLDRRLPFITRRYYL